MTKRCVALVASAVFVLVGLAIILTVRPSPTLTIRCSNVTVIGGGVHPTLEISNTHQGHSRSFPQLGTIRRGTLPRMPKLAKIAESESRRSRIQFTLHENGSCIEAGTNSRNSTGSDCEESGASNMLGLSSGALSAAQPQNRADAALRRVRLKHAQLNGLNLRVTADRTAIAGLSRTGTGRAEQGKKEFDFDR